MAEQDPSNDQPSVPVLRDSAQRWALLGCFLGILMAGLQMTGRIHDPQPYLTYFGFIIGPLIVGTYAHRTINAWKQ